MVRNGYEKLLNEKLSKGNTRNGKYWNKDN